MTKPVGWGIDILNICRGGMDVLNIDVGGYIDILNIDVGGVWMYLI